MKKNLLLFFIGALMPIMAWAHVFHDAEGVNFSLPAGRCYLTSSGSSVKAFQFAFGDDATGIELVNGTSVSGTLYDLQGRRVTSPARNIYILRYAQSNHQINKLLW